MLPDLSFFSIVVNGNKQGVPKKPVTLFPGTINSRYLMTQCDVYHSHYYWSTPVPWRWFIEPKADKCVFIDVDIIACNSLAPLYALDSKRFYGVQAFSSAMSKTEWQQLGFTNNELANYYFNFGMLVVPSSRMRDIGNRLMDNVFWIVKQYPHHFYFSSQIALAYTLKEMGIQTNPLSHSFNWYDKLPFPEDQSRIMLLHYFTHQNAVVDTGTATSLSGDPYAELISRTAKSFYAII
jgi:lipopolysaccharide biosynthesis glycosyltransferase